MQEICTLYLSMCRASPSICLPICLSVRPFCLSVHPSIYLFIFHFSHRKANTQTCTSNLAGTSSHASVMVDQAWEEETGCGMHQHYQTCHPSRPNKRPPLPRSGRSWLKPSVGEKCSIAPKDITENTSFLVVLKQLNYLTFSF